jgi:phosphotransferase system enzyme I (PtsI)
MQLRAILRASAHGEVKILLPMISSLDEIRETRKILEEVKKELRITDNRFEEEIEIGVMIEVPSAAMIADLIAQEVDFLSIGTNDLIQYTMAADRGNEHIAHLYQAFNPAVLRMIKMITDAGHNKGVWVGMCGEMAGDALATILLVGLDLDELSVSPFVLPAIKEIIRSITYADAKKITDVVMQMDTSEEIESHLKNILQERFPFLLR